MEVANPLTFFISDLFFWEMKKEPLAYTSYQAITGFMSAFTLSAALSVTHTCAYLMPQHDVDTANTNCRRFSPITHLRSLPARTTNTKNKLQSIEQPLLKMTVESTLEEIETTAVTAPHTLWTRYVIGLKERPVLTKAATSGTLNALQELIATKVAGGDMQEGGKKAAQMGAYGWCEVASTFSLNAPE